MGKKTYFVDIANREISQIPYHNNTSFKISATSDEVQLLRDKMNDVEHGDDITFYRANVPIYPYHHDKGNDLYDDKLLETYQMLYSLGDEATQEHIASMGILPEA